MFALLTTGSQTGSQTDWGKPAGPCSSTPVGGAHLPVSLSVRDAGGAPYRIRALCRLSARQASGTQNAHFCKSSGPETLRAGLWI